MTMLRVLPRDGDVPLETNEMEKDREHRREQQARKLRSCETVATSTKAPRGAQSRADAVTKTIRAMRKIRSVLEVSEHTTEDGVSYLHVVVVPTFTG